MEALFCFRQQFFCLMAAKIQGQPQKPRQLPGHIGPEFPQGPQQAHAAEHRVGGVGQPRPPAAQHPQQVVYQAPGGSQGHGGSQGGQLTGHIVLHPSPQPSSRVSQEPRGACCSS